MALNAPVPIVDGSQTEFSKVFAAGSGGTATLPNVRLYRADGRIQHPIPAQLDVTFTTSPATLLARIKAAAVAAGMASADFDLWWSKAQIVGMTSAAITGATLLVMRAESTGVNTSNTELDPTVVGDFFAHESFATGAIFTHGPIPGDASGAGTIAVAATLTEVSKSEDSAHASGDKGIMALAVRQDTPSALAGTSGDYIPLSVTSMGRLRAAAAPESISTSGTITNSGDAVTVTGAGAFNTLLFVTDGSAAIIPEGTIDGTNWFTLPFWNPANATPQVRVATTTISANIPQMADTLSATSVRVRRTSTGAAAVCTVVLSSSDAQGTTMVSGTIPHGQVAAGNPVLVGLEARNADGSAVGNGDIVRALASLLGKAVTLPYALPASTWQYAGPTGGITDTADDQIVAAVASTRHYITALQIVNMSTTATEVVIKDGSTVIWRCELDADGGAAGISMQFPTPLRGTANTALNVACLTTSTKVFVNAQGFSAAE